MPLHSALTGADLHAPGAHKTQHEDGGTDAISLTGLTGAPLLTTTTTAVTQSPADNSTKIATTAYADAGVAAAVTANLRVTSIPFVIDGGGAVITTGIKGDIEIPFAGTITAWRVLADASGSITIDTWKDTYANFPPAVGDTMWGTKPNLSGTAKNEGTGLSIAVTAGDIIRYNVDSATTVTRVTLSFTITKS